MGHPVPVLCGLVHLWWHCGVWCWFAVQNFEKRSAEQNDHARNACPIYNIVQWNLDLVNGRNYLLNRGLFTKTEVLIM